MKRWIVAAMGALHLLPALAADKDPLDYPLRQYGFLLGVAVLGGIVSFYAKVRAGQASAWNVMHLIGELCTSAFAGLMAFWICEWAEAPKLVTVAMVGIAGHMGARAISAFEAYAQRRLESLHGERP